RHTFEGSSQSSSSCAALRFKDDIEQASHVFVMGKHDAKETRKKHRRDDDGDDRRKHKKHKSKLKIVDDDDQDMWVEKNIDLEGDRVLAADIPTAESLELTSSAIPGDSAPHLPPSIHTESKIQRDDWMLQPQEKSDFFSSLGAEV